MNSVDTSFTYMALLVDTLIILVWTIYKCGCELIPLANVISILNVLGLVVINLRVIQILRSCRRSKHQSV